MPGIGIVSWCFLSHQFDTTFSFWTIYLGIELFKQDVNSLEKILGAFPNTACAILKASHIPNIYRQDNWAMKF